MRSLYLCLKVLKSHVNQRSAAVKDFKDDMTWTREKETSLEPIGEVVDDVPNRLDGQAVIVLIREDDQLGHELVVPDVQAEFKTRKYL